VYLVPDLNKTMVNVTNEPNETHIKTLEEEIMEEVTEKLMKTLDMVNQKVQEVLKKFQDITNKYLYTETNKGTQKGLQTPK
jgi:predicted transglutaminase-like cysteine proteinase